MTERFTEQLRELNQSTWHAAVNHRFVEELVTGTVDDRVITRYLIQDHRFLDSFLILVGAAMSHADSTAARLRYGRFAGMVSSEENTYFLRAFTALGVTEQQRLTAPDSAPTAGFKAIMREATTTGSYAAILTVLNVAEWLYSDWASQAQRPLPENFVYAEWVTLHDNPDFNAFVAFIREELDRVGPAEQAACEDLFRRAVTLEKGFFDAAYQ